ncbi:hypothetical protein LCGC14_2530910, partial [marine sediment metagenome]
YMRDVVTSEQKDIQQGDIPVFSTRPASLDLYDASGRPIRGVLTESGMSALRRSIAQLNEEDLQRQVWYIRASIATLDSETDGPVASTYRLAETTGGAGPGALGARLLVANWFSNSVSVIDAETLAVTQEIETGDGPRAFGRFIPSRQDPAPCDSLP